MLQYSITWRWLEMCLCLILMQFITSGSNLCPDPGVPTDGEREGNLFNHGDIVHYHCKDGFKLVGEEKVQCLTDGDWSSKSPHCEFLGVHCVLPPSIPHGHIELRRCKGRNYCLPDEEVTVVCDRGYMYNQNSRYVLCKTNGQWENVFGNCTEEKCPDPGLLSDGKREGNCCSPGDTLRFSCNESYGLVGQDEISCSNDLKWSSEKPHCSKIKCPDPGVPADGERNGSCCFGGDTIRFSCNDGYDLEGENELRCLSNETWSSEIPLCTKNESCPDPGLSRDGERSGNCCIISDVLKYSCSVGYQLVGEDEIHCLPDRSWSARRPICRPNGTHCNLPPPVPNGAVSLRTCKGKDFCLPGQEVTVRCKPGYSYNETSRYIMCQDNSQWENGFGNCTDDSCDKLEQPLNGRILELETANVSYVTYMCESGFRLVGDTYRFCERGRWKGKTPYCSAIKCPDPGTPEHGRKFGDNLDVDAKVEFYCFSGYTLLGSRYRDCLPNGQWSGELARCDSEDNYCPNPGVPINGLKNSSDYDFGAIVGFSCGLGYYQKGSKARVCLQNRTWSGQETTCLGRYDFDNIAEVKEDLQNILNEKIVEQKEKHDEYLQALMDRGVFAVPGRIIFYFLFDASGSITNHNFKRSIEFAKAVVKKVGISESGTRAGAITFSSNVYVAFQPTDYSTTEEVLEALDNVNFTGGGTATNTALQFVRENSIPLTEAVLKKDGQKSIVFILTDGKANMGGDPQEEAKALKDYGVEIFCIGITGDTKKDVLYKIASDESERRHVFMLDSYETLAWLIEDIDNGTIDYSRCGIGLEQSVEPRVVGGTLAAKQWPWLAAIFAIPYGTKDLSKSEFQCGGSIINKYFILTAAHCVQFRNSARRNVDEIIIKLGLKHLGNETLAPEPKIKEIFIHPKYYAKGLHQYDVALLLLREAIEYNPYVRPICLAPKDLPDNTKLYNASEYPVAVGWGHQEVREYLDTKKLIISKDLKQIHLIFQPIEKCKRMARRYGIYPHFTDKEFADVMFCAGDGLGGNDTCKGDSGGPVMQNEKNEHGDNNWILVGVVGWGFGCGLPDHYAVYNNVSALREWIDQKIKEESPVKF